jgi:hypothetical protein
MTQTTSWFLVLRSLGAAARLRNRRKVFVQLIALQLVAEVVNLLSFGEPLQALALQSALVPNFIVFSSNFVSCFLRGRGNRPFQNGLDAASLYFSDALRLVPPRSCSQGSALSAGWL